MKIELCAKYIPGQILIHGELVEARETRMYIPSAEPENEASGVRDKGGIEVSFGIEESFWLELIWLRVP